MLKLCSRCSRILHVSTNIYTPNLSLPLRQNVSIFAAVSPASDWSKAFADAEKIVGYSTSFMSLRCLLSDELSNIALHLRKLVGTKHPLLKTAKRFIYDGTHTLQTRGLLVLLISKAAGPSTKSPGGEILENMVSGIYQSQRLLAEIAEMIHTAYLVHRDVVDLAQLKPEDGPLKSMEFGNKMAVLSGDFLLANASKELARLQNTRVVEVVASALQDLMCAEFHAFRTADRLLQLPTKDANMLHWEQQTYLASGSLLAKSCQSAMMLAGHSEERQEQAFKFGKYMAYTYQLREDLDTLEKHKDQRLTPTSAPVIMHLERRPDDDLFQGLIRDSNRNRVKIRRHLKSSGTTEKVHQQCQVYGQTALDCLIGFEPSEAKTALENLIRAIIS